jgi:hypothetical protein
VLLIDSSKCQYIAYVESFCLHHLADCVFIATALMRRSQREMADVFDSEYVSLHVRKSNRAAFHLYSVTLKYGVHDVEKGYYADGEDAYDMRCYFKEQPKQEEDEKSVEPPSEEMQQLEVANA